ncbi:cyclase family protein [Lutimonas zeaxanthinifaciens]|uniref:cyclase family protein n=1 Tax=Lutimonas zeaxanthinifaciens TaxID=3060215 RepID=UPI00265D5F67|nr:cyclase family protein [Lutimonas sp. YSD2104]WKK66919.1 cyclase family protein [Lutimonas sp. YSD2104]
MNFNKLLLAILFLSLTGCLKDKKQHVHQPNKEQNTSEKIKIIDLSHDYSRETVYWVTAKEFELDTVFMGETDKGYYYAANNFSTAEHGGTHIDAPIHFAKGGQTVDEIPLERLIGKGIKVDVSAHALSDTDYLIRIDDFLNWEKENNRTIPENAIVLLQTGHSEYYPQKEKYLGTDQRGNEAVALLHFPGLSPEAAKWLVQERKINAIGIDTPSIDYGQSKNFQSHVILLSQNIPAFENLTNLDQLPNTDFEIIALPMKIKGGSGAPLRIIALIKD